MEAEDMIIFFGAERGRRGNFPPIKLFCF